MSADLIQLDDMIINSFFGGVKRGQCLQFTPLTQDYAQITRAEAVMLRDALNAWLDEPNELAALRDRVAKLEAERDASILQLMDEVEMRHGVHENRWQVLRDILENSR